MRFYRNNRKYGRWCNRIVLDSVKRPPNRPIPPEPAKDPHRFDLKYTSRYLSRILSNDMHRKMTNRNPLTATKYNGRHRIYSEDVRLAREYHRRYYYKRQGPNKKNPFYCPPRKKDQQRHRQVIVQYQTQQLIKYTSHAKTSLDTIKYVGRLP